MMIVFFCTVVALSLLHIVVLCGMIEYFFSTALQYINLTQALVLHFTEESINVVVHEANG